MMRNWLADICANCWRRMRKFEVVAECANGFEAVKAIAETSPDLLFLDVQMPKLDGFEVLELIEPAQAPVVVFVTAYDQYAMRAFDAHAVDYLLKPFSAERFERALERARARLGERRVPPDLAPRGAGRRRAPATHRRQGRHARACHSHRQAGLRGGPGRLRRAPQRGQELSEAAAHRRPGSPARPGLLRAHPSLRHEKFGLLFEDFLQERNCVTKFYRSSMAATALSQRARSLSFSSFSVLAGILRDSLSQKERMRVRARTGNGFF